MSKTHYDTLGISRDASEKEIKQAFRAMSMKYHPDKVVSNAKLSPALVYSSNSFSINRAALKEIDSGLKGANPAAIRSALMKRNVCASLGKKFLAKVVFPAPLGPAIMIIFLLIAVIFLVAVK